MKVKLLKKIRKRFAKEVTLTKRFKNYKILEDEKD